MEEYYYFEELPLALQYGMNEEQFWDGRCDLIYVYEKAYINRIHTEAYLQGAYVEIALSTTMANMFRKKGAKPIAYPSEAILNPFNKKNVEKSNSYLKSIDTTKNNNGLYQIKAKIEERRKKENGN